MCFRASFVPEGHFQACLVSFFGINGFLKPTCDLPPGMQKRTNKPQIIRERELQRTYCAAAAGLRYTCSLRPKESPAAAQTHPCEEEMPPQSVNVPLSEVAP